MSAIDTKSLRELAQGATKGPWVSHEENGFPYVLGPDDELLGGPVTIADGSEHLSIADAAYIAAASPDVILGLLDEVDRLRAERDTLLEQANAASSVVAADWHDIKALRQQLAAVTAARDELAYLAESLNGDPSDARYDPGMADRITHLRSIGAAK
jgi:hypothetical protein